MSGPVVGVDALGLAVGGGLTWLSGLVPALARVWPKARFEVLVRRSVAPIAGDLGGVRVHAVPVPRGASRMGHEWFGVPAWVVAKRIDVLLVASDAGPAACPCPFVQTAQNAKIYTAPGTRYRLLRRAARASARAAAATVYVSDALRAVAQPVLAPRRAVVIRHGTSAPPEGTPPRPLPDPYVLVVATPYAHKDVATALAAVLALRREGRPERLVLLGGGGDPHVVEDLRRLSVADPEALFVAGPVPPEGLEPWYAHAGAFLLSSREESFGFPLAEALARGVPSVASDIPALRETGREHARYHAVGDAGSARDALVAALADGAGPAERRARGLSYAARWTWEDAARRYREALEAAGGERALG
jgi:glycosyltransferase involved in cell wall biosynthesis